jgi:hypothetical protein
MRISRADPDEVLLDVRDASPWTAASAAREGSVVAADTSAARVQVSLARHGMHVDHSTAADIATILDDAVMVDLRDGQPADDESGD